MVQFIKKYLPLPFICLIGFMALGQPVSGSGNYSLKESSEDHPGYFEHLPDAYEQNKNAYYPLILFLHGQGERDGGGQDELQKLTKWGPPRIVAKNGSEMKRIHPYRFIILAPQLKEPNYRWTAESIDEFIRYATETYRVDKSRIYLTGISMGGNGVWNYAYSSFNNPNKIAAIAPIAGWGKPSEACKIVERQIPVWAFHGINDPVISFGYGKSVFSALSDCGLELSSKDFRFSSLNAMHNSWPPIYSGISDSITIYDWFMDHRLMISELDTGKTQAVKPWKAPEFKNLKLQQVAPLNTDLYESSGIEVSQEGNFFSHNDSGNEPVIFKLNQKGAIIGKISIASAKNVDWEDLTTDNAGNLYIGDIGNNLNSRRELTIYKVKSGDLTNTTAEPEMIRFTYEDQKDFPPSSSKMHYDAESLIHYNNSLYIFTKNRTEPFTGYTHIYQIPDQPGNYKAQLVDSLKLGEGIMTNYWLTSADISPSGDKIALLTHDKLWILSCFSGKKFSEGSIVEIRLDSFTQKEAVVFTNENTLFFTDERIRNVLGGNLYTLTLPADISLSCD
jgi:predicted esterase